MQNTPLTVLLILSLAGTAVAQDGGKLPWRGKGGEDPRTAMADSRSQGRPMLLFFTSLG